LGGEIPSGEKRPKQQTIGINQYQFFAHVAPPLRCPLSALLFDRDTDVSCLFYPRPGPFPVLGSGAERANNVNTGWFPVENVKSVAMTHAYAP
ncbi:hypothetical protein ABTM94_19060, partial [Acinetobacter baumannii]